MKRFLYTGLIFCFLTQVALAKNEDLPIKTNATLIDIIYIHGAYETREAFDKSVENVHEDMIEQFQSDPLIYKKLLKNGCKKNR